MKYWQAIFILLFLAACSAENQSLIVADKADLLYSPPNLPEEVILDLNESDPDLLQELMYQEDPYMNPQNVPDEGANAITGKVTVSTQDIAYEKSAQAGEQMTVALTPGSEGSYQYAYVYKDISNFYGRIQFQCAGIKCTAQPPSVSFVIPVTWEDGNYYLFVYDYAIHRYIGYPFTVSGGQEEYHLTISLNQTVAKAGDTISVHIKPGRSPALKYLYVKNTAQEQILSLPLACPSRYCSDESDLQIIVPRSIPSGRYEVIAKEAFARTAQNTEFSVQLEVINDIPSMMPSLSLSQTTVSPGGFLDYAAAPSTAGMRSYFYIYTPILQQIHSWGGIDYYYNYTYPFYFDGCAGDCYKPVSGRFQIPKTWPAGEYSFSVWPINAPSIVKPFRVLKGGISAPSFDFSPSSLQPGQKISYRINPGIRGILGTAYLYKRASEQQRVGAAIRSYKLCTNYCHYPIEGLIEIPEQIPDGPYTLRLYDYDTAKEVFFNFIVSGSRVDESPEFKVILDSSEVYAGENLIGMVYPGPGGVSSTFLIWKQGTPSYIVGFYQLDANMLNVIAPVKLHAAIPKGIYANEYKIRMILYDPSGVSRVHYIPITIKQR